MRQHADQELPQRRVLLKGDFMQQAFLEDDRQEDRTRRETSGAGHTGA